MWTLRPALIKLMLHSLHFLCRALIWAHFQMTTIFVLLLLLRLRLFNSDLHDNLSPLNPPPPTHRNFNVWLKCATISRSTLASLKTAMLARARSPFHHFCYVTHMVFIDGVKCPSFHDQFLNLCERSKSTLHFSVLLRVNTLGVIDSSRLYLPPPICLLKF